MSVGVHIPRRLASVVGSTLRAALTATPSHIRFISNTYQKIPTPLHQTQISLKSYSTVTASATPSPATSTTEKKKVVFLGTPEVAALVLKKLIDASKSPDSTYELSAVVSQPGRPKGRSRQPQPTPVEQLARDEGFDLVLCPEKASDPTFLDALRAIQPDLCITAAYGNYLPTKFLSIPKFGTLNIHPSLLPSYRGAAPVQRSLQDGLLVTGVTVLYTVKEMDAGPILAQQKLPVDPDIQAPELLDNLFTLGTELLIKNLEIVWARMGSTASQPQNDNAATHAPKITREEGLLDFTQPAIICHNKVRAFAGWPGTYHTFTLLDNENDNDGSSSSSSQIELKILQTRVVESATTITHSNTVVHVDPNNSTMKIVCGDGNSLEILRLQAPGRKPVSTKDYINGIKGKILKWNLVTEH